MGIKTRQQAYLHSVRERLVSNDVPLPPTEVKNLYSWQDVREDGGPVFRWRDKIRSGDNAGTYMRAWKSESPKVIAGSTMHRAWHTTPNIGPIDSYSASGDLANNPGFGVTVPSSIDAAYNSALVAIFGKIKQAQTQMSGLVFAGELREVLQLIRSPAKSIANKTYSYLGDLQRWRATNRRAGPKAYKDKLAESYLAWSFGVKPLINDVEDGAKALAQVVTGGIRKARVSTEWIIREERITGPQSEFNIMGRSYFPAYSQSIEENQVQVRWICGLRSASEGPSGISLVNSAFGLAVEDFVPAAWNLLPWSFLADYFTNIGDVLEATFTDTSSVSWSLRQTKLRTRRIESAWANVQAAKTFFGAQYLSSQGSKSSIETVSTEYRRDVIGLDRPSFQVRVNLNAGKVANMAALGTLYRSLLPFGK